MLSVFSIRACDLRQGDSIKTGKGWKQVEAVLFHRNAVLTLLANRTVPMVYGRDDLVTIRDNS